MSPARNSFVVVAATVVVVCLSSGLAWAAAPSHANIHFTVPATLGLQPDGTAVAPGYVSWTQGTSGHQGVGCCSNDVSDDLTGTTLGSTTASRFSIALVDNTGSRFRIDSYDFQGNYVGTVFTDPPGFIQDFNTEQEDSFTYRGTWTSQSLPGSFGGTVEYSTARGSSAKVTCYCRALEWITTKGPSRGSAKVYIDGTYVATISTHATTVQTRRIVFKREWGQMASATHTLKIVNAGTAGHSRVDVDGFAHLWED